MNDLFGQEIKSEPKRAGQPKGYAAAPGTGPDGQFCRTCAHAWSRGRYWKCDLVNPTRGPGTDIRLKSPACRFWDRRKVTAKQSMSQ